MIYGSRVSLVIGLVTMCISGLIGTVIGVAAGYFGGRVDHVVNFVVTTRLSMTVILVALAVVAIAGSSMTGVVLVRLVERRGGKECVSECSSGWLRYL